MIIYIIKDKFKLVMQEVETKFQKYRFSIREKHIENYKKSIRFERSLETMRKGLRQGEKNADVNI